VQKNSGGTLKIHNSIIGADGGLLISVESGRLDRYGKLDSGSILYRARLRRLRKNLIKNPEASGHGFAGCEKLDKESRSVRARFRRLRKNSIKSPEASGHDFSRADKAHRINRALAPAVCFSRDALEKKPFPQSFELLHPTPNWNSTQRKRGTALSRPSLFESEPFEGGNP
jgi:hypothetical protein